MTSKIRETVLQKLTWIVIGAAVGAVTTFYVSDTLSYFKGSKAIAADFHRDGIAKTHVCPEKSVSIDGKDTTLTAATLVFPRKEAVIVLPDDSYSLVGFEPDGNGGQGPLLCASQQNRKVGHWTSEPDKSRLNWRRVSLFLMNGIKIDIVFELAP